MTPLPDEADGAAFARIDPRAWLDDVLDEALLCCDHAGRVVEIFGPTTLLPADPAALTGRGIAELSDLPSALRQAWSAALERALDTQHAQICAYRLDRGEVDGGGERSFEARFLPLGPARVVVAIRDVGERDGLRERIAHHASRDELTGLGNLRALRERLDGWLRPGPPVPPSQSATAIAPVALLIVDLDRFKQGNDLHGRSIGDSLLRLVAQRIRREAVRASLGRGWDARDATMPVDANERIDDDSASLTVARIGGDQFAVAWRAAAPSGADPMWLAERLIATLGTPTRIAGQTLFVRASIGVATFPDDARDPSALFALAEAALKRAKLAGRNQARRHGDDVAPAASAALPPNTEVALRAAIAASQFLLVYQPKFELASSLAVKPAEPGRGADRGTALAPGAIVAVEALVRWRTPSGALLIPHEFIPLAEASGMIRPLGDWVLHTALAEVSRFASDGGVRVGVAINVSLLQLHDRTFVQTVMAALREHGFSAGELTIELAETAFVEDIRLASDALAELSSLGVRLAIDHFGIGTGGLVALKTLPIDEIKIDRSFIAGAAIDAFDATIVAGLIRMAHDLGKTVTAEGVERVDQIASLSQMRCDAIQGYFVGEPMTAAALVATPMLWQKTPGIRAG